MKRRVFLIPSLLAAGLGSHDPALAAQPQITTTGGDDPNNGSVLRNFSQDHLVTLASHSSHSSHSSHASHSSGGGGGGHYSHTSHRSSTGGYDGGGYYSPVPAAPAVPAPPPPPPPPPVSMPSVQPLFSNTDRASAPAPDGLPVLSGRTKRFAAIVRRVQIALLAQDYYHGPINGLVGPALRTALRGFQTKRGLEATGTITPPTLDALMVSSQ